MFGAFFAVQVVGEVLWLGNECERIADFREYRLVGQRVRVHVGRGAPRLILFWRQ